VIRSGGPQCLARNLEIGRALDLERSKMRIPPHRRHLEHRVLEGELRLLRHHCHAARHSCTRDRAEIGAVERDPSV
jgi:hypothetical protein